ncbi:MAG: polysaccharide deacetylase family protein [Alphaproteobacteria bacterium]
MQHKTYEDCNWKQKAVGKARQMIALFQHRRIQKLPQGFMGLSICFDDFPQSAAEHGAAILEDAGLRGTFYTCFDLLGTDNYAKTEDVLRLHKRGHEIACHTYDHINPSFNDLATVKASCAKNVAAAHELKIQLDNFCYPQSGITPEAKRMASHMYGSSRSGFWGINTETFDAHCLKSLPLYQGHIQQINTYIDRLTKEKGWLVLYTHDVSEHPTEHGISPDALSHVITTCMQQNIVIKPIHEVMNLCIMN